MWPRGQTLLPTQISQWTGLLQIIRFRGLKCLIKKIQKIYIINKLITSFISFFIRAAVYVIRKYWNFFDSRLYSASIAWISLKMFWEFCEKVDPLIPSVKDLIRLESKTGSLANYIQICFYQLRTSRLQLLQFWWFSDSF